MNRSSKKQADRRVKIVLVLLIVTSGLFLTLALSRQAEWLLTGIVDYSDDTPANSAFVISVVGLNDNETVSVPLINAPFLVSGAEIDKVRVAITWTSSGSGLKWETLLVSVSLQVSQLNKYDTWVIRHTSSWTDSNANSSITKDLVLGVDICKAADMVDSAWYLEFRVTASSSVQDLMDQSITKAAPTLAGKLNILWTSSLDFSTQW